jgi:hypothetical protein
VSGNAGDTAGGDQEEEGGVGEVGEWYWKDREIQSIGKS